MNASPAIAENTKYQRTINGLLLLRNSQTPTKRWVGINHAKLKFSRRTVSRLQEESPSKNKPVAPKTVNTTAVGQLACPCFRKSHQKNQARPPPAKVTAGDNHLGVRGKVPGRKISLFSLVNFCCPSEVFSTARSRSAGRKQASRGLALRSTFDPSSSERPNPIHGILAKYGSSMRRKVK
jgi:hypothetical protein